MSTFQVGEQIEFVNDGPLPPATQRTIRATVTEVHRDAYFVVDDDDDGREWWVGVNDPTARSV